MIHSTNQFVKEATGIASARLFSEETCKEFIAEANTLNQWGAALIHGGNDEDGVRWVTDDEVRIAMVTSLDALPRASALVTSALEEQILPFVNKTWRLQLKSHSGGQIIRYTRGGRYDVHADSGPDLEDRMFSIICYLNDDFVGGSTRFPTISYEVIPRTGNVVLFPSEYLHQAEPVLEGTKYVLVSWVVGDPPVTWI